MDTTPESIELLLDSAAAKERQARKRAMIYTAIPILLAIILLWFTSKQIVEARQQIIEAHQEVIRYERMVAELEKHLRESTQYVRHLVQLDWSNVKVLYSRYPRQADILEEILRMRNDEVKWKLGGSSPAEGFDSPSFAAYLLERNDLLPIPFSERYRIQELMPRTSNPEVGDLIFYDTGYTMFYFEDRYNRPFCVGMTPAGIVALEIRFGPRLLGYGIVDYSRMRRRVFE